MRSRTSRQPVGLGGRYRIDGFIGHGGRADVFRGWDRERDRPVAIKWVCECVDPSSHPRRRADADELRRLVHVGLVRERGNGIEDGRPYVVMDLAGSTTLRAATEEGPLSPHVVASVARQLAAALGHLHDNGVVHGHLTADKVLMGQEPVGGSSRVWLDCGPWVPDAPPPLGSLAPELRNGEESTVAGDIWALGALIGDCLVASSSGVPSVRASAAPVTPALLEPWRILLPMMLHRQPQRRPTAGQVAAVVRATWARAALGPESPRPVQAISSQRATDLLPGAMTRLARHWSRTTAMALLVVGVRAVRAAEEHPHPDQAHEASRDATTTVDVREVRFID